MLKVKFGLDEDSFYCVDKYFNNVYEDEWFEDDMVKQIVKDIDDSEVKSAYCVVSPVLGSISVEHISGGAKGLILLLKEENIQLDLTLFGENCEEWIVKISKLKDIYVTMYGHDLTFRGTDIEAICVNDGSKINNAEEWVDKMFIFV